MNIYKYLSLTKSQILITVLFIFIFIQNSFSQVVLDWKFSNTPAYNYYPTTNLFHTNNGTYICSQSIDVNQSAYVFRLNDSGTLLNQDSIQYFNYSILENKRMAIDNNGSIYLAGTVLNSLLYNKIRIIKYDYLLNRLWDVIYEDTSHDDYTVRGIQYSKSEDKIYLISEKFDGDTYRNFKDGSERQFVMGIHRYSPYEYFSCFLFD